MEMGHFFGFGIIMIIKKLGLSLTILIAIYITISIVMSSIGVAKGYKYIDYRKDYAYIERFGELVIEGNVISLQLQREYILGLRIPTLPIECGSSNFFQMSEDRNYFILNTLDGRVEKFTSKETFHSELKHRLLFHELNLDYSKFDHIFEFLSGIPIGDEVPKGCSLGQIKI